MNQINFKKCQSTLKLYKGSTENKGILYGNKSYMLKYMEKKMAFHYLSRPITYFNSIFSEYIACSIGRKIGLNIQETLLGFDIIDNKYTQCVACKDFCDKYESLIDMKGLFYNINRENNENLKIENLQDTLKMIELQNIIDSKELKKHFLDMFVFDAFIGNFDRNYKNWGIIFNENSNNYRIAPIYDCASSLHPKTPRTTINKYYKEFNNNNNSLIEKIKTPTSYFTDNFGEKINYYNFLVEREFNQDKDIAEAILRVAPKLVEIHENGYIEKLVDSLSELMGEDRAKVLKIELEYKAQHMFKEMIRIANKVLEKEKEQTSSWIKKDIDDDWER